jgi:hypothetical protein
VDIKRYGTCVVISDVIGTALAKLANNELVASEVFLMNCFIINHFYEYFLSEQVVLKK